MSINIEIIILGSDGSSVIERYPLNFEVDKSVGNLKQVISARLEGAIVSMTCQGRGMDSSKTLRGNGVQENNQIHVFTDIAESEINVVAQLISSSNNNKPVNIRCSPNTTTENLISLMKSKISFSANDAYYTFNGNNLQSGKTLKDQGIGNNATVHIGIRVRGG